MNLEKLKPWNWFKHEESEQTKDKQIPVTRNEASQLTAQTGADSLMRLHREVDQLFDSVFNAFGLPAIRSPILDRSSELNKQTSASYSPSIDVSGDEQQYEITLDVPGLSQNDISIEVSGDLLRIIGQQEETSKMKDKHFYRVERRFGSFQRTLSLPEDAIASDISASLESGVLNLTIPRKTLSASEVKRIPISGEARNKISVGEN